MRICWLRLYSAPGRNRTFVRRLTAARSSIEPPEHIEQREETRHPFAEGRIRTLRRSASEADALSFKERITVGVFIQDAVCPVRSSMGLLPFQPGLPKQAKGSDCPVAASGNPSCVPLKASLRTRRVLAVLIRSQML